MKKFKNLVTATAIVAVLFSCGGSTENNTPADTTAADHHEHAAPANATTTDTAVIKDDQGVFFENLKDGQVVSGEVLVKFGVKNMTVQAANPKLEPNKGHHHLLVDTMSFIPAGTFIPKVAGRILHFGKGETETKLKLKPGKHKLALQFANGIHFSYGIKMSKAIEITVK